MLTYSEALSYLNSFVNFEQTGLEAIKTRFDLDKLKFVLKEMGDPQKKYKTVHIAGTKGKGSTAAFVSSMLRSSGFRTGLYISPHVTDLRERISVDGEKISEMDLCHAVSELKGYLDDLGPATNFTYFEVFTLMSMLFFMCKKVDYAVFECGLGGRLDATNVIDPEVSCITSISYDHMQILGNKLTQIASEKAAIIKQGVPCVTCSQKTAVMHLLKERCSEVAVPLIVAGKDIQYKVKNIGESGTRVEIKGELFDYGECEINMLGDFQPDNAALAVGVFEQIVKKHRKDFCGDIIHAAKAGISNAYLPGRMEIVSRNPLFVIDGAHNGDSAERLKSSVEQIFKYDKVILILGISNDKDIPAICKALAGLSSLVILTRAGVSRSADPHLLRGYFGKEGCTVTGDSKEAVGMALASAHKSDMILATGSFFLISEIRDLLLKKKGKP
ncbi:MAG TPA: folylpolyglutamate synthase/dihydrofolate synthase family protein [Candidatus Omnitrophota bacterium]|nr:folylpolyglutamate synthase/dihydrofolate synthase family protein [Candidatus Omnitrophota bacterium]HPS19900.1 folylpolyglutamate synthase/dihydrofolate synthase family protein [Candidatus Omnitrophota bacterium]